jgi:N-acetyl-gamma-glutamyl-phosphate reductase
LIRTAIVGASGYSGAELLRFLSQRADVAVEKVIASSSAGKKVAELYPAMSRDVEAEYEEFEPESLDGLDVVFVALPSGEGMKAVPQLVHHVDHVIDLGGDFRLKSSALYEEFYGHKHTAAGLLCEAVYGLPELSTPAICAARLVANPGCYATSALLALLPALSHGVVEPHGIVINSLSGVSGAGRSSAVELSFAEVNENVRAYKVGNHQHIPEIQSTLEQSAGEKVSLSFVPHLIPITRGIYTTIHCNLRMKTTASDVLQLYTSYYASAPFVRIKKDIPQIRNVVNTNYCDIGLVIQERTQQLIIMSVIDNLIKGAAGQAIQNMNIMLGLPEESGLKR